MFLTFTTLSSISAVPDYSYPYDFNQKKFNDPGN